MPATCCNPPFPPPLANHCPLPGHYRGDASTDTACPSRRRAEGCMRIWTEQMGISPGLPPRMPLPFVPFLTLEQPVRQDGATTTSHKNVPCGTIYRLSQSLSRLRCATFSGDAGETASLVFLHRLQGLSRGPPPSHSFPSQGKSLDQKLCAAPG